jgi:hypothetical protein
MDYETQKKELMKHARNAFETASTLQDSQRIEVYMNNGEVKTSDVLEENDEILYTDERILCYQVYGHNFLEEEIKTWIDYARVIQQPTDETPLTEPTDIEKSIREMIVDISKAKGVQGEEISSYEVFANLPVNLLGTIEQEIIEYWWSADEDENGKKLALAQIEEAIGKNISEG